MRSLRWVGLVFSLLIVGVLGGLMAPLPSEAIPELSVKIEASTYNATTHATTTTTSGPTPIPLQPPIPCNGATDLNNYNYCFLAAAAAYTTYGPTNRKFSFQNVTGATGGTAQVKIGDYLTGKKKRTIANMTFVPVGTWAASDLTKITLILKNEYKEQPGPVSTGCGTYQSYSVTVGGSYGAGVNASGNILVVSGTGTFDTQAKNTPCTNGVRTGTAITNPIAIKNNWNPDPYNATTACPPVFKTPPCGGTLYFKTVSGSGFGVGQFAPFPGAFDTLPDPDADPTFACNNRAAVAKGVKRTDALGTIRTFDEPSCQPLTTTTAVWSELGPDPIILDDGLDEGSFFCGDKRNPCADAAAELTEFYKGKRQNEKQTRLQNNIPEGVPCGPDSSGVDHCTCTVIFSINTTPAPANGTIFRFALSGPDFRDIEIPTDDSLGQGDGYGEAPPFTRVICGQGVTDRIVQEGVFPPLDPNSVYKVDQVHCTSQNGTTIPDVDCEVTSGPDKLPFTLHAVGEKDFLRINMHLHGETIKKAP